MKTIWYVTVYEDGIKDEVYSGYFDTREEALNQLAGLEEYGNYSGTIDEYDIKWRRRYEEMEGDIITY